MYKPNYIKETLSGGFTAGVYGAIVTAVSRNYGVFHIDYGKDENGVPFAEIGLMSPYPIETIFPRVDWDSYFVPEENLSENEKDFYRSMKDFYNKKVFPIVFVDITLPGEVSREFVSGIDGKIVEEFEEGQEVVFNIHTYTKEPFDMREILVKCTYEPKKYKDLKIGNVDISDDDSFEDFVMWYLTKWISLQPRISTEDHLD